MELVPCYYDNLLKIPETFYMNNFVNKENIHAILSYQWYFVKSTNQRSDLA